MLGIGLLVAATVMAYVPALRGGFVWDDDRYVTENPTLTEPGGLGRIWFDVGATVQYYPLTFTTFWIDQALWGQNPLGYHVVNVVLHVLNAILFWLVLQRLAVPGAWFAAALFALHPVQVESVAWITERKNVLAGVFFLLTLLAYIRFCRLGRRETPALFDGRYYVLAVFLFAGALLSKTATCPLPAVILLLLWWKRDRLTQRDVVPLLPLFALGIALALTTSYVERHLVGAPDFSSSLSVLDRFLSAGRAWWFYAGKLVVPLNICFIYPRWEVDAGTWWQYLYPLGAVVVLLALWLIRRRISRGPLVGVLIFGGLLFPVLGLFDFYFMRYSFVADHFQYFAGMGIFALFAAYGSLGWREILTRVRVSPAGSAVSRRVAAGVILMVLGVLTWRQGGSYRDLETLWRDTLAKNPSCWLAYNNLAAIVLERGEADTAREYYRTAIRLNPDFRQAHFNLGQLLREQGDLGEAVRAYEQTLRIKPDHLNARMNLVSILLAQDQTAAAVEHLEIALRFAPQSDAALYNLGWIYQSRGEIEQAIPFYQDALESNPDHANAHYNLANALAARDRVAEAVDHWRAAIRLKTAWPEAHYNLGVALEARGALAEAIAHFQEAVRANPDYIPARLSLGNALLRKGDLAGAAREYREVLRLEPENRPARQALEQALAEQAGD